MKPQFIHRDLELIQPDFNSPLTGIILELEKLRGPILGGPVHPHIFFELKEVFQMLESFGSARIEGNRTTLSELIEKTIEKRRDDDEQIREIANGEDAMDFIEDTLGKGGSISQSFILEAHKIVTRDLTPPPNGEGSRTPGQFRNHDVIIQKSMHKPPSFSMVTKYFNDLLYFINESTEPQNELLITAIAHHRFAWIHPFDNGNGRLVRLLTYAMLIKQGFNVHNGRILNPTAIFCVDRDKYYHMLAQADRGGKNEMLAWCEYVLTGLLSEIHKIDQLLNRRYLTEKILLPAIVFGLENKYITKLEYEILRKAVLSQHMEIVSGDIESLMPGKLPAERSRTLGRLKRKKMLVPVKKNGRKYVISFFRNYLLRGVIDALKKEGFVSAND
ncbi:MAG: Fic family protein [Candidatus Pacebacteria bacterium]|nr:Fic family protein [Candidatus Paceibacterota bacterium]